MNAERLHAIARVLQEDFKKTDVATLMDQLMSFVTALSQNPSDANAAEQLGLTREQLREQLAASRTNEFPDSWRLALEELGIWDLTGDRLADRIESVFARHEMTLSTAQPELSELHADFQRVMTSTDNLVSALDALGIGAEDLAPGEFEVGFLIPREAVDNELEQLGKEFEKLDGLLLPFAELSGEGRPDLRVRSIASSEFQIFLMALPGLALTVSKVVESLLNSYERIRRIRDQVTTLEEQEVPPEAIEPLKQHASERMEIDINALTNEVIGQATADLTPGRQHELQVEVRRSLTQLATRIDEGYSIEVRAFSPPEEGDEDDEAFEDVPTESVRAARAITERQPRMRTMNLTGRPILELTEGDEDEPGEEAEGPGGEPNA